MLDKLKTLFTIQVFNKENDVKNTEIYSKLKQIHREIKEKIMDGTLENDFTGFMDMWEEIADIDMLLTNWESDGESVQRRLINEEMSEDDEVMSRGCALYHEERDAA